MSQHKPLSQQAFWAAVERRLATYSADALRAIVYRLAQDTAPDQRAAFLDRLQPTAEAEAAPRRAQQQAELLAAIDDVVAQLRHAMANADDDYWEYSEEDSLGPYADFVGDFRNLFDQAAVAFDGGQRALARDAYERLFAALTLEDDVGRGVRADDLPNADVSAARARYLRSVYDTTPPRQRPKVLVEAMRQAADWARPAPTLDDLIRITPEPLPDRAPFLTAWIARLRRQRGRDADAWLREAVWLDQGLDGLAQLAKREGQRRPHAYLDWVTALVQQGAHRQALTAAQQALAALPARLPLRAAIADQLCLAAAALRQTKRVQDGRWQAFLAKPELPRLIQLWQAIPARSARTARLRQAADYLQQAVKKPPRVTNDWDADEWERPAWPDEALLAHAMLLSGQWDAAYQRAAAAKGPGWHDGADPQGLVLAFLLLLLTDATPATVSPSLGHCWRSALSATLGPTWRYGDNTAERIAALDQIYTQRLANARVTATQQHTFLSGCLAIAERRINRIVRQQQRRGYADAAHLACACAETLQALGDDESARQWLNDIRAAHPRHRAFQAELNAAALSGTARRLP